MIFVPSRIILTSELHVAALQQGAEEVKKQCSEHSLEIEVHKHITIPQLQE